MVCQPSAQLSGRERVSLLSGLPASTLSALSLACLPLPQESRTLSQAQMRWISSSETFILGTFADGPDGGADASNRGGNPGFVQATDERTVVFPDYKVTVAPGLSKADR